MNNSIAGIRGLFLLGAFLASTGMLCAKTGSTSSSPITWTVCTHLGVEEEDIKQRIKDLSSIVDMRLTPEVLKHIDRYLRYKKGSSLIIGRQISYFPLFEDVLIRKNLPTDLKYLTVVESSIRPSATSRVGAAGLWQLMRPTGRMLGLKINREVDERRNPYRSTEAATEYLQMLYDEFDDWTLALAAYNSGPGRVRSAIRKSGSRDYWTLRKFLPRETRHYVPAYIAATYLSNYYYMHEITPVVEDKDFMSVSNIQIYDKLSFSEIAEITGTSVETIKSMNPGYLRGYVPGKEEGQHILLPNYAATLLLHHLYRPDLELEYIMPVDLDNTVVAQLEGGFRTRIPEAPFIPGIDLLDQFQTRTKPVALMPREAIPMKAAKWYKLGKRESLYDVSQKQRIPINTLLSLNDKIPNNRMIRLQ